jgi:hypothetical protein
MPPKINLFFEAASDNIVTDDDDIMITNNFDDDDVEDESNDNGIFTFLSDDDDEITDISNNNTPSVELPEKGACKKINDIITTQKYDILSNKTTEGTVYVKKYKKKEEVNAEVKDVEKEEDEDEIKAPQIYKINKKDVSEIAFDEKEKQIKPLNDFINKKNKHNNNLLETKLYLCNAKMLTKQRRIFGLSIKNMLDDFICEINNPDVECVKFRSAFTEFVNEKLYKYINIIVNTVDELYKSEIYHNDLHYDNVMIENEIPIIIDYGYVRKFNYQNNYQKKEIFDVPIIDIGQLLNTIIIHIEVIVKKLIIKENDKKENDKKYINNEPLYTTLHNIYVKYFEDLAIDGHRDKVVLKNTDNVTELYTELLNDIIKLDNNNSTQTKYMKVRKYRIL